MLMHFQKLKKILVLLGCAQVVTGLYAPREVFFQAKLSPNSGGTGTFTYSSIVNFECDTCRTPQCQDVCGLHQKIFNSAWQKAKFELNKVTAHSFVGIVSYVADELPPMTEEYLSSFNDTPAPSIGSKNSSSSSGQPSQGGKTNPPINSSSKNQTNSAMNSSGKSGNNGTAGAGAQTATNTGQPSGSKSSTTGSQSGNASSSANNSGAGRRNPPAGTQNQTSTSANGNRNESGTDSVSNGNEVLDNQTTVPGSKQNPNPNGTPQKPTMPLPEALEKIKNDVATIKTKTKDAKDAVGGTGLPWDDDDDDVEARKALKQSIKDLAKDPEKLAATKALLNAKPEEIEKLPEDQKKKLKEDVGALKDAVKTACKDNENPQEKAKKLLKDCGFEDSDADKLVNEAFPTPGLWQNFKNKCAAGKQSVTDRWNRDNTGKVQILGVGAGVVIAVVAIGGAFYYFVVRSGKLSQFIGSIKAKLGMGTAEKAGSSRRKKFAAE